MARSAARPPAFPPPSTAHPIPTSARHPPPLEWRATVPLLAAERGRLVVLQKTGAS